MTASHDGKDAIDAKPRDRPAAYFGISLNTVCCFKRALFTVGKYSKASQR